MAEVPYNSGVPTVAPAERPPEDYQHIDARPEQFGALIARGEQQAGEGLNKASNAAFDIEHFWQEGQTDDALNGFMENSQKIVQKYQSMYGSDAVNHQDDIQKEVDELWNTQRGYLKSDQQRLDYDKAGRPFRARYIDGMIRNHAVQQGRDYLLATNQKNSDISKNNIPSAINDENEFLALRGDMQIAAYKNAQVVNGMEMDSAIGQAAIQKAGSEATKAWIDAILTQNPERADAMTEKYKTDLGALYFQTKEQVERKAKEVRGMRAGDEAYQGLRGPPLEPSAHGRQAVPNVIAPAWRAAGMSNNGIAGVAFNISEESGFDPTLRHPDQPRFGGEAHFAHGFYQEGGDEWMRYERWLAANHPGADWRSGAHQSEFAAWNLKTNYPQVWQRMNNAATPEDAARIYASQYLKPAAVYLQSRIAKIGRGIPSLESYGASGAAGQAGLPTPAAEQAARHAGGRQQLLADIHDPTELSAALEQFNRHVTAENQRSTAARADFTMRENDTKEAALRLGGTSNPLTEAEFIQEKGPVLGPDLYRDYVVDLQYGADRKKMTMMSEGQMRDLVESRAPKEEAPGFAHQAKLYDKLAKGMDEIIKERYENPAGSVADDPTVKKALAAYNPNQPQSFGPVAAARMAAQETIGIDPDLRTPITKAEALQATAPLRRMLPGEERDTVRALAQDFQKKYGPNADTAFAYALRVHQVNAETAQQAASVMRKLMKGEPLTRAEAVGADQANEVAAASAAVGAPPPVPSARLGSPGRLAAQAEAGRGAWETPPHEPEGPQLPPVKPAAISYLLAHPDTAAIFDKEYARPGLAKEILEKYGMASAKKAAPQLPPVNAP